MGSAYHNKGVQLLLDAICDYAPSPLDVQTYAMDILNDEKEVALLPYGNKEFVGLAFKLEEGIHGQLTYIRAYQGTLKKGTSLFNVRTRKKVRSGRLVRMHSNEMVDVQEVKAGEICASIGMDCASGDTITSNELLALSSIHVPPPVVSLGLKVEKKMASKLSKALNRFTKEDLTFQVSYDPETYETSISGMGELHLEIYVERIKREYGIKCETGKPQVAFRETTLDKIPFDLTHKKQTGGSGQYAKIIGYIEHIPLDPKSSNQEAFVEFENKITNNCICPEYIQSVKKGFIKACETSPVAGYRVTNVKFVLCDGKSHPVDSSDYAFNYAAVLAFKQGK